MAQPLPDPSPHWRYSDPATAHHFGAEQYAQQAAFLPWLMPQPQMGEPPGPPAPQGIVPSGVAHPAQHDGHEGAESEDEDETDNAEAEKDEEADNHAITTTTTKTTKTCHMGKRYLRGPILYFW